MTTVERPHGRAKYNAERCHCETCCADKRVYENNRRRQRAYGREAYVDAGPAREHVNRLRAIGVGPVRIAEISGVHRVVLKKLLYGDPARGQRPVRRMRKANADRLLAVPLTPLLAADGAPIDIVGTRRRLQALVAIGWPMTHLAEQLGAAANYVSHVLRQPTCSGGMARSVAALYDRLWNQLPAEDTVWQRRAVEGSRTLARQRGWAPPLAWDDDTIDDPAAVPDLGVASKSAVDLADDEWLRSAGVPDEQIAARMGVTVDGLQTARRRARVRMQEA